MGEQEESRSEDEESHPSVAEILTKGYPPEFIPLLAICGVCTLFTVGLSIRAVFQHKSYISKFTMQALCTLGIVQVYPLFSLMYFSGMVVPKALSKCTFIAESYEAVSLLFFLRLMITYMGGRKQTIATLTGTKVSLANPPLCLLKECLPRVTFSATYLHIHMLFVVQLVLIQLVFGYIDLMMIIDMSMMYPAHLIEEQYSHVFHLIDLASLLLAVYGLGAIYHSAEHTLKKYQIFYKFICYKVLVTIVKVQDVLAMYLVFEEYLGDLSSGAFSTVLRVHFWCCALAIAECTIMLPLALRYYGVGDYPSLESLDNLIISAPEALEYPDLVTSPSNGKAVVRFSGIESGDFSGIESGDERSDVVDNVGSALESFPHSKILN